MAKEELLEFEGAVLEVLPDGTHWNERPCRSSLTADQGGFATFIVDSQVNTSRNRQRAGDGDAKRNVVDQNLIATFAKDITCRRPNNDTACLWPEGDLIIHSFAEWLAVLLETDF